MTTVNATDYIARFTANEQFAETACPNYMAASAILRLSLMDWAVVSLSGIPEPVSAVVRDLAIEESGTAQTFAFGLKQKLPARAAALVNGATSHALDYDDTHFLHVGHTSVVVFSAALAIAERQVSSGMQFLKASLIGSEVACAVGDWLGRSHYQAGFHQTATAGTFGATAAAARLLGLDHDQTQHALGLAATKASGLTCEFGTMAKPYHAGMAAMNGVEAALLAGKGFKANKHALHTKLGFADTHHADKYRLSERLSALGSPLLFTDVQHKFHACCHGLHACIEALQTLKHTHEIASEDISSIQIFTNPRWLNVCNIQEPSTGMEAKFSYRWVSALVFSPYSTAALDSYSDAHCSDPMLISLRDKTEVLADSTLVDTHSAVSITLLDGTVFKGSYNLCESLPYAERRNKMLNKSRVLIGHHKTTALIDAIDSLERQPHIRTFCETLASCQ